MTSAATPVTSVTTPVQARSAPRGRYLAGLRSTRAQIGIGILVLILLCAYVLPAFLDYGPLTQSASALAGPSSHHWLGTDEIGRDILARVLAGIRTDVVLVIIAVPSAAILGPALGLLSGLNRLAGSGVQRIFDILLGFPGVVMGVAVGIAISPGRTAILVAIILVTTPAFGRLVRITTLTQLSRDYVAAARIADTSPTAIVVRHILPNVADAVIVRAAVAIAQAIQIEGGLSVIGLGIQPPQASLGSMIAGGSAYLQGSPLYSLVPVGVVFVIIIGCTLIADALNEAVLRR